MIIKYLENYQYYIYFKINTMSYNYKTTENEQAAVLNFSILTVEFLEMFFNTYITLATELNDRLSFLSNDMLSWNTFIQPSLDFDNKYAHIQAHLQMSSFHPNKEIRDKCTELETKLEQFNTKQSMRRDLFEKFRWYYENVNGSTESLTDEQKRYLEVALRSYKMNGLYLQEDQYNQVKEIKNTLSGLTNKFSKNLTDCNTTLNFTEVELDGLQENWLSERKRVNEDGGEVYYEVSLKYPDYVPVMEYAKNRNTRKIMFTAFNNRCADTNVSIATECFSLRHTLAQLFGFSSYADYKMQVKMAKTADTVNEFLQSLHLKSDQLLEQDKLNLLSIASSDNITSLEPYDIAYYSRLYIEQQTSLDQNELKQCFPLETVQQGMFEIYQTLFGYKFTEITEQSKNTFWHEDVRLYNVHNSSDGKFIGQFYTDLFPREGKYGHAAIFTLIPKSADNPCICAMACNFSKTENLTFDFVETFFHEFGHIMHDMSSEATIASLAGTSCERDAVELPSQQLEEWCYRSVPLKMMSVGITDEIIEKLVKQKNMLQGLFLKRQLSFGMFDMRVHSGQVSDINDSYRQIYNTLTGMNMPVETSFPANFSHIISGYDAGYYGYLWSKVYAVDIFETMFKGHELDPEVGMRFRKEILSYGATRDMLTSLIKFLGRPPSNDAFLKYLLQ